VRLPKPRFADSSNPVRSSGYLFNVAPVFGPVKQSAENFAKIIRILDPAIEARDRNSCSLLRFGGQFAPVFDPDVMAVGDEVEDVFFEVRADAADGVNFAMAASRRVAAL